MRFSLLACALATLTALAYAAPAQNTERDNIGTGDFAGDIAGGSVDMSSSNGKRGNILGWPVHDRIHPVKNAFTGWVDLATCETYNNCTSIDD